MSVIEQAVTSFSILMGLVLGARHALEPDHLAAVSSLVTVSSLDDVSSLTDASSQNTKKRRGPLLSLRLGALWGLGHALTLMVVSGTLVFVGAQLPTQLEHAFELGVAGMVVALGVRAIRRALHEARVGAVSAHTHHGRVHSHRGPPAHLHLSRWTFASRPLFIGALHGLAGSGALTALVVAELGTPQARLGAIALFGLGSVVGMAVVTSASGAPLRRLTPRAASLLSLVAGVASVAIGLHLGWSQLVS